jgi:hypothetical protein
MSTHDPDDDLWPPRPAGLDPPPAPDPPCSGDTHRWRPTFDSGDTCSCGAFYLNWRTDGVVEIQEAPANGSRS